MNARLRVFGAIGVVFVLASGLLYVASTLFVQAQFSKIETGDTQKNAARAVDALTNRVDQLAVKNSDWSNWDDTYAFITNKNKKYIDSNLQSGSLKDLGINFMLFYNRKHELVYSNGIDPEGNDITVPPQLLSYFKSDSKLFADDESSLDKGFVSLPDYPVLLAARPIMTSDGDGPSRGTVVFAQYLTGDEVRSLAELTHLNLDYYRLGDKLPSDVSAAGTLSPDSATVRVLGPNSIAGYQTVNDVFGKPLLAARVEMPRDSFVEAGNSLRYFLLIIALVTLFSIVLSIVITNQLADRDRTIQLKNEFFSIASHELRTPLTVIRGNSDLLQQMYGPKNDQNFGTMTRDIYESSTRLIRLVTNFLDAARLECGKVPLSLCQFTLRDVVASVADEMQGLAAEKKLYIRSKIPARLPAVWADRDRVKQVVYNLVGNAAKFTDKGGITITAEVQGQVVRVMVADTGRGISTEGQKALFRKFQQTKASDGVCGSGLGLYISKTLVQLMGGEVRIESSAEGKGTTLSFSLPIATKEQADESVKKCV